MKIGIVPINVGGAYLQDHMIPMAQHAEEAGLESVWTFEHAIIPVEYESRYPYARSGKMGAAPETWFIDPLVSLAAVAGATSSIRLGTGVNILPQTNPLLFAKQAASIDVVSKGRLMLGLGVGWLEEEFKAMGTPFGRRGRRFTDYVEGMKKVWSGDVVEHKSEFLDWSGFKSYPLPHQRPHPPLIFGGTSKPALRRTARQADGWFAPNHGVSDLTEQLGNLKEACEGADRAFDEIEITAMWVLMKEPDAVSAYEDLGVSRLIVPLMATGEMDWRKAIDKIADTVAD